MKKKQQKSVHNRMGIRSGVTRIFNISRKLRLGDPLRLRDQGKLVSRSVETWLKIDPLRLWREVYEKGSVELAKDSFEVLMTIARVQFPELYEEKEARKALYRKGK